MACCPEPVAVIGFTAINCVRFPVPSRWLIPMSVLGVKMVGILAALAVVMICGEMTLPPAAKVVGMYVMGKMVGQDCAAPVAATSWMLASC